MVTIACTGQSEARGHNRWFRLAEGMDIEDWSDDTDRTK
jgi:hypothetical protein